MSSLRALVLGGAGFLGSHLCERLVREGCDVLVLDDFSTGSRDNLATLEASPRLHVERWDVRRPLEVRGSFDWIFNLASPASPVHYQSDPVKTTMTNVLGTLHALQLAVRTGARMLQASTSEVYGDPDVHPQPESYAGRVNPVGIRACYDEGKRCAESIAMDFVRQRGADLRLVRIFNTYGPRMMVDDGRVVSNFVVQALRGEDLTVYGDGSQTRSFCYVDDLIDGFVAFIRHAGVVGPLNLGNPSEFTMLELARAVLELTHSPSRIVHVPLPEDDPKVRRPDITRARAVLGFEPKVELRQGLSLTIAAFERCLGRMESSGVRTLESHIRRSQESARSVAPVRALGARRTS